MLSPEQLEEALEEDVIQNAAKKQVELYGHAYQGCSSGMLNSCVHEK